MAFMVEQEGGGGTRNLIHAFCTAFKSNPERRRKAASVGFKQCGVYGGAGGGRGDTSFESRFLYELNPERRRKAASMGFKQYGVYGGAGGRRGDKQKVIQYSMYCWETGGNTPWHAML